MTEQFKLSIIVGDDPTRNPAEVAKGFDEAEIAAGLQLIPFEGNDQWTKKQAEIASWNTAPIRISSHYLEGLPGQRLTGPNVDSELQEFYTKRFFTRLANVGVKTIGIGAWCFPVVRSTRAQRDGCKEGVSPRHKIGAEMPTEEHP